MAECEHITHPEHWLGDCGDVLQLRNVAYGGRIGSVEGYPWAITRVRPARLQQSMRALLDR